LVETAWNLNINPNLLEVKYDEEKSLFFLENDFMRRIDITSVRDSLNGYQKGKCFYSFKDISVVRRSADLCDVDHFLPHLNKEEHSKNGANINAKENTGKTSLHYAALSLDCKLIATLLLKGADETIHDNDGKLPRDMADPKSYRKDFLPSNVLLDNYKKMNLSFITCGSLKCPVFTKAQADILKRQIMSSPELQMVYKELRSDVLMLSALSIMRGNKFNLLQALIDIANEMKIVKKKEYKQKSCLFKLSVSNWSLLILIMLAQGSTTGVWLYSFIYVVIAIIV
jgi:hypothetical protein